MKLMTNKLSDEFDDLVARLTKIDKTQKPMNPTINQPSVERQPIVQFEYPDSVTAKMKVRYVRVTEANADYIKGEELAGPNSVRKGVFKAYLRDRMVQNGVALVSF